MKTFLDSSALSSGLNRVGLKASAPLDIDSDTVAETWTSDYAELYLVDAASLAPDDMPGLLSRLDSIVAKRLRQQRDAGRFLDAHVCILVAENLIQNGDLARESDASRYVSRKYWIDRDGPVEEILRRLTLTWVDVDPSSAEADLKHLREFADLRKRIAARKGAGAASDFLQALAT
jgi:hypothetical protein